ncbi:MAG: DUF4430 domain-containing protein [Clostridiales Family XIII bacterium]|nr:DUF4430 domain-containing protein [Clostridiales Family XIII bacterium]
MFTRRLGRRGAFRYKLAALILAVALVAGLAPQLTFAGAENEYAKNTQEDAIAADEPAAETAIPDPLPEPAISEVIVPAPMDGVPAPTDAVSATSPMSAAPPQGTPIGQVYVSIEDTVPTPANEAWPAARGIMAQGWVDLYSSDGTMDVIRRLADANSLSVEDVNGYITTVGGLGANGRDPNSGGWMCSLNDWFTNEGFSSYTVANGGLSAGDTVSVMYSLDWGPDIGSDWANNNKTLKALTVSNGAISPAAFNADTKNYTLIPTENVGGFEDVIITPTAYNKNFQTRIYVNGTEVKRTQAIPVADGTKIKIIVGRPDWPTMNSPNTVPEEQYTLTVGDGGNAVNTPPSLKGSDSSNAEAVLGDTWQLDLFPIFEDADIDALTYSVSVNGAASTPVAGYVYQFKPTAIGDYTLRFKASDGQAESSAYTVNLTVRNATVNNVTLPSTTEVKNTLNKVAAYQLTTASNPSVGTVHGEGTVLALARGGYMTDAYKNIYLKNLYSYIRGHNGNLGQPYTDYSRIILALSALNVDATNVAGYNLVARLAEYENVVWQGVNGPIHALLALDSKNYDIPLPTAGSGATQTTRERLVRTILNAQLPDGGWSIMGPGTDVPGFTVTAVSAEIDITAMALQGLAPYYKSNGEVREAVEKALSVLSDTQSAATGGWSSSEGTAQVLIAMNALNIELNDARFVKNRKTAYDGLMSFYYHAGGYFKHTADGNEANAMSTDQGMYALVSLYRTLTGANSVYDMTEKQATVVDIPADNTNAGVSSSVNTNSTAVAAKKRASSDYEVTQSILTDTAIETPPVELEALEANIAESDTLNDAEEEKEAKKEGGLSLRKIIGIIAAIIVLALITFLTRQIVRRNGRPRYRRPRRAA